MYSKIFYFAFLLILYERNFSDCNPIFGEYVTKLTNVSKCTNEPVAAFEEHLIWNNTDGVDQLSMMADITRPIGPLGGDLITKRWNGVKYVDVIKMKPKKWCDILFFGSSDPRPPEIQMNFKIDHRCYLPKGKQWINITDANKITHTFLGNQMFYGKYYTKVSLRCGKLFIGCREVYSVFEPTSTRK